MFTETVEQGSRQVVISANTEQGPFTSRLYVNSGETATSMSKKAKSLKGARRQALKLMEV